MIKGTASRWINKIMSVSKVFMVFVFLRFYDFLTTLLENFPGFAEESAISNKTISLGQQRVWRFKIVIEFSDDGMSYNIFVSTLHLNRLPWNRFSWKASKILNTFDKALFLMRLETSQIFSIILQQLSVLSLLKFRFSFF